MRSRGQTLLILLLIAFAGTTDARDRMTKEVGPVEGQVTTYGTDAVVADYNSGLIVLYGHSCSDRIFVDGLESPGAVFASE